MSNSTFRLAVISALLAGILLPVGVQAQETQNSLGELLNTTHDLVSQSTEKGDRLKETLRIAQANADQAAPSPSLPNGASSISENYGDWTVDCAIQNGQKLCAMSQAQGNNQTGQQVFAMNLRAPQGDIADGALILPFGLAIQTPVTMKIDDQPLGQGARFSTCIPAGCVVPIAFPTAAIDALKKGTILLVTATNLNGSDPAEFKVSLSGFTAAVGRVEQLAK